MLIMRAKYPTVRITSKESFKKPSGVELELQILLQTHGLTDDRKIDRIHTCVHEYTYIEIDKRV